MRKILGEVYILALALTLRLLWTAAVPVIPVADSRWYNLFAQNLALGYGYCFIPGQPTVFYPVGPGFLYSLAYRLFGFHLAAAVALNLVVALLGIHFAMRFAALCFNRRIALLTGLLLAIWPGQIEFVTTLSSELPFNLFLLLALVCWKSNAPLFGRLWLRAICIGLFAAAASYMRPIALLLTTVLCLIDLLRAKPNTPHRYKRPLLSAALSTLVMLIAIAPWTLRNYQAFHTFIPISANFGDNLYHGNYPSNLNAPDAPTERTSALSEPDRDRYLAHIAIGDISTHPIPFAGRAFTKIYILYSRENAGADWNQTSLLQRYGSAGFKAVRVVSSTFWLAALALALTGLELLRRQTGIHNILTHPCFVLCAYFTSIYAVTQAQDRFHFACVPFLAILAAFTLATIGSATRRAVYTSRSG
jgi:4-amino-4-deoxy-L-arabinose transferase-like glycosyltransferase